MDKLSLETGKKLINKAIEFITTNNMKPSSIAIVDEWGELISLYRMDNAPFGTLELARDKAWTAAAFKLPSAAVKNFGNLDQSDNGLRATNWNDHLITSAGGLPIQIEDKIIGGIGVSGDSPENDVKVCETALNLL